MTSQNYQYKKALSRLFFFETLALYKEKPYFCNRD